MPSDTAITEKALNKKVPNAYEPSDNSLDLIKFLTSFFDTSAKTIYEKVNILGSCPILYDKTGFGNMKFDKYRYQRICELALNDFIRLNGKDESNLYSVSINFKTKNLKGEDVYTLGCAFAASEEAKKYKIKPFEQGVSIEDSYDTCKAETKFNNNKYEFIDASRNEKLPHHGISFSERFIEKIDFDNMKMLKNDDSEDNDLNLIYTHTLGDDKTCRYKIDNENKQLESTNIYEPNSETPYYKLVEREELVKMFDDGSNTNPPRTYPNPEKPIQHRNQAAFFPIECTSGTIVKRVGYIQLTAYYIKNTNICSCLTKNGKKKLDDKIVEMFKFYSNLVLLANKIFNISKTKIEKRSDTTYLVSIGKDNNIKAEPLSNRCLINYEET